MASYHGHHQYRSPFGDTTFTKVFVGGLAWETPTDRMRAYFEQFGDILEAVIITDKITGKSKGYGFVTFRDSDAAQRACSDPNPMIDGRRANCNIASFGRPKPSPPRGRNQVGVQGQASSTSYSGLPTPQQTLPTPYFYHYGYPYTAYTYQGLYNQQMQQSQQYYAPYYGGSTSTSSIGGPFYYGGYSLPNTRTPAHRITAPPYVYYPTQLEGAQLSPYFPNPNPAPAYPPAIQSSNSHQVPSSTEEQQAHQQSTPIEGDTGAMHSEGQSN